MAIVDVCVRPDALYVRLSGLPKPTFDKAKEELKKRCKAWWNGEAQVVQAIYLLELSLYCQEKGFRLVLHDERPIFSQPGLYN